MSKFISLLFFIYTAISAQSELSNKKIGDFSEATCFSFINSGYFIVGDYNTNEIYKIDTTGILLKEIGGYGWQPGLFDFPAAIHANELNTYICDKNNDRIVITDRDLNFLSIIRSNDNNTQVNYKQPTCFGVNNQSDFFILDSYNQQILKFDLRGNFIQQIGSYDQGDFYLSNPINFALSPDGKLFASNSKQIFVFDQFGLGLIKISSPIENAKLKIFDTFLTIFNNDTVYTINLANLGSGFNKCNTNDAYNIVEAIFTGTKLFVLTEKNIFIYEY